MNKSAHFKVDPKLAELLGETYRSVFGAGKGVSWDFDKTFNAKKGIKTTSAKEWAAKNLDLKL